MLASTLAVTTALVNNRGHHAATGDYDSGMDTLLSRMEWVLNVRGISERQLSLRSGLSHAAVSNMLRSLRRDPASAGRVAPDTLEKIAAGASIDATWLKLGIGVPEFGQELQPNDDPVTLTPADEPADDPDLAAILKGQGLRARVVRGMHPGLPALLSGTNVLLQSGLSCVDRRVICHHELGHHMLAAAGMPDPHGDVWRLALASMMPRPALRLLRAKLGRALAPADIIAAFGVPWWAPSLRLSMTSVNPTSTRTIVVDGSC